jgi:membrane protein implicated in regulation of membrane protease activity
MTLSTEKLPSNATVKVVAVESNLLIVEKIKLN